MPTPQVHPAISREAFTTAITSQPELTSLLTPAQRTALHYLVSELAAIEPALAHCHAVGLKQQLIHGDLHHENCLVDEAAGNVTGVLDFEFVAMDWWVDSFRMLVIPSSVLTVG